MNYGIYAPNFGPFADARVLAFLARDAEDAGWDGFFTWDHLAGDIWPERMVDAWIALAAIALHTSRIRIGALITPLPRRRPWKVARETVSIDRLSGGRLIFGVGVGDGHGEWDDLGEETDLKTRGAMLDEGLQVLTGLWSGEPFSFDGTFYRVKQAHFLPTPVQQPRIPVWVAGHWPNRAPFRRAARWDGAMPSTREMTPEKARELIAFIHENRHRDAPFDFVFGGATTGIDPAADTAALAPYAEIGMTWWLEHITPVKFGAEWKGDWPLERMRARILAGPPKADFEF